MIGEYPKQVDCIIQLYSGAQIHRAQHKTSLEVKIGNAEFSFIVNVHVHLFDGHRAAQLHALYSHTHPVTLASQWNPMPHAANRNRDSFSLAAR